MAYEEKKPEAYPSEANGPAHEARYQEILAGYRDQMRQYAGEGHNISLGYDAMKKNMAQVGDSQRNALDRQFAQQYGQAQQSMISRGLGNTTVLDAARRGIGYDQANANITLADALAREQAQIHQAKLNQKSQFAQGLAGLQGNMLGYEGQYRGTQQAQDANYGGQYGLAEQTYRMDDEMYQKQLNADAHNAMSGGWSITPGIGQTYKAPTPPSAPPTRGEGGGGGGGYGGSSGGYPPSYSEGSAHRADAMGAASVIGAAAGNAFGGGPSGLGALFANGYQGASIPGWDPDAVPGVAGGIGAYGAAWGDLKAQANANAYGAAGGMASGLGDAAAFFGYERPGGGGMSSGGE